MAIMLDANVMIRGERGTFDFDSWVAAQPDENFEIAAITVAELWRGVERATAPHRIRRERYLEAVLAALPIIPYTDKTAYLHAHLWAELELAGTMSGFYDLIVAASALERGSTLATFNLRHFAHVPGLSVMLPE